MGERREEKQEKREKVQMFLTAIDRADAVMQTASIDDSLHFIIINSHLLVIILLPR